MKSLLLRVVLTAAILFAVRAPAELILYKGSGTASYIGDNRSVNIPFKLFLIVDFDTGKTAQLLHANLLGNRIYSVLSQTNLSFVQATGARSRIYTALVRNPSGSEDAEDAPLREVFAQGANSTLTLAPDVNVSFPKTLSSKYQIYSEASGQPGLINGSAKFSFDKKATLNSNASGQTLDQALDTFVETLVNQGYTPADEAVLNFDLF